MSNVIICDRDGSIVKSDVMGQVFYSPNPEKQGKQYMLCPSCSKDLWEFLTGLNGSLPVMKAFDPDAEPELESDHAETTKRAIEHHTSEDSAYDYEDD